MSTIESHSTLNISETVKNRGLDPKDDQQEMAYGESNGHVTDTIEEFNVDSKAEYTA